METIHHTYEVPEPFKWDESFKVFYKNLDSEHQDLFKGVFAVATDKSQKALDNLFKVAEHHFQDEEGQMGRHHYSNLKTHKAAHDKFLGQVKGLKASDINENTLNWCKNWLVHHIKDVDFDYREKIGTPDNH
uniref:Hemerythrin n=1 Tax=Chaetopterus variopedatus TaxID=34590 RepID=A0A1S6QCU2_CHAVR|nr:hemerythrin [Chaetopterus variopedatus]